MMSILGKNVKGTINIANGWSSSFILTKVVATEYGIISQISADLFWGNGGKSAKGVIFSHDALNDRPLALLNDGVSIPVVLDQFNDFPGLAYTKTPGEILWIGVYCENAPYCSGEYMTGYKTMVWTQGTYPTVPEIFAPVFAPSTTELEASIYATYTPITPPTPPPTDGEDGGLINAWNSLEFWQKGSIFLLGIASITAVVYVVTKKK